MAKERYFLVDGEAIGSTLDLLVAERPQLQGKTFIRQRREAERLGAFILTPLEHFMLRKYLAENDPVTYDFVTNGRERLNQVIIASGSTLVAYDSPEICNGKFSLKRGRDVSYLLEFPSNEDRFVIDDISRFTGLPLHVFPDGKCEKSEMNPWGNSETHRLVVNYARSKKSKGKTIVPALHSYSSTCTLYIDEKQGVKRALPELGVRLCYYADDETLERLESSKSSQIVVA
ncbi:hypothetical protein D6817_00345 [Candidatus Pacearchaeota archaeon]|nr:MAG: hypothetical protein D6817_00345 [Candidatus Pacearchaeota archaeon]